MKNQERQMEVFDIKLEDTIKFDTYYQKVKNYIKHIQEQHKILTE